MNKVSKNEPFSESKRSIYGKINRQVLFSSVVSALAVCIAAVICMVVMRGNVIEASEHLGTSAADDSKAALEQQMRDSLLLIARNKAAISDEKLAAVAKMVTVVSNEAAMLVSQPSHYLGNPPGFPDAANAGKTVAQLRLADEEQYSALENEIGLFGNLNNLLVSQYDALSYVGSVYIGTETGISISADGDSDKKVNVYDPRTRGWYQSAGEAGEMIWTDIFVDNSGRGLAITCAEPFYDTRGNLRGVTGAGMLLDVLMEIVIEAGLGETGYAFITNERGELIITDTVETDDEGNVLSRNLADLLPADTAELIIRGAEGIERVDIEGQDCFIAYAPLGTLPWSMAVVMSVDEVIAPAVKSGENIIGMTRAKVEGIDRMILVTLGVFAAALLLTLAANTLLARRLATGLAKPIIELSEGANIIGAGDFEHRLNVKTGDELEALSDTFNAMIDNIKTITAEKERIGAELDVATKIQASMLPCIFPAFPEHSEFDIYASMQPAKEVGGDFYDLFLVDSNTLAVVVADVSGKGIPAALFMVIAKTLIKNNAQLGKNPAEVFEAVNNILCENNDAGMFGTAFMGYLDIASGKLTVVNAGHNHPLIARQGGGFEWLKVKAGFILAGMENMRYTCHELYLQPGDKLYLYTDGVTEAVNEELELFGDPRLLEVANEFIDLPVEEFSSKIKSEIEKFAAGAEQADDITMLTLKYLGS